MENNVFSPDCYSRMPERTLVHRKYLHLRLPDEADVEGDEVDEEAVGSGDQGDGDGAPDDIRVRVLVHLDGIADGHKLAHGPEDADGQQYRNKTGIGQWENALGPGFLRIHRAFLVNRHNAYSLSWDSEDGRWKKLSIFPIMPNFTYRISFGGK